MAFNPKISERGKYKFAEFVVAAGPHTIGVTGDNSYDTLFGREWLLILDSATNMLQLYQEDAESDGQWTQVVDDIPNVFNTALPEDARRISLAFDQSARIIIAYESEGIVKVTRWDLTENDYLQNVSFSGTDPVLLMDASINYHIPGSDVILFYRQSETPGSIFYRIQREQYGTHHELFAEDTPLILDRAVTVGLRYHLLVSDANGDILSNVLRSGLYPAYVSTPIEGEGSFAEAAYRHFRDVHDIDETTEIDVNGLFHEMIYTSQRLVMDHESEPDSVTGSALMLDAIYTALRMLFEDGGTDGVTGEATMFDASYHEYRALTEQSGTDSMTGSGGFLNATYQEI